MGSALLSASNCELLDALLFFFPFFDFLLSCFFFLFLLNKTMICMFSIVSLLQCTLFFVFFWCFLRCFFSVLPLLIFFLPSGLLTAFWEGLVTHGKRPLVSTVTTPWPHPGMACAGWPFWNLPPVRVSDLQSHGDGTRNHFVTETGSFVFSCSFLFSLGCFFLVFYHNWVL